MKKSHGLDYATYIGSEEWALRKTRYYATHGRECARCGPPSDRVEDLAKSIHLHHLSYERMGHESDIDLMPLCEECHSTAHAYHIAHKGMSLHDATRMALGLVMSIPTAVAIPPGRPLTRIQRIALGERRREAERLVRQGNYQRALKKRKAQESGPAYWGWL